MGTPKIQGIDGCGKEQETDECRAHERDQRTRVRWSMQFSDWQGNTIDELVAKLFDSLSRLIACRGNERAMQGNIAQVTLSQWSALSQQLIEAYAMTLGQQAIASGADQLVQLLHGVLVGSQSV
ncbi:MAG: hypothetical protein SH868_17815 [Bythopirellula sp.]|nr:hypothetical protein [Bythopirellula sp.]